MAIKNFVNQTIGFTYPEPPPRSTIERLMDQLENFIGEQDTPTNRAAIEAIQSNIAHEYAHARGYERSFEEGSRGWKRIEKLEDRVQKLEDRIKELEEENEYLKMLKMEN